MAVGFLLCGFAGTFPERIQPTVLALGIGLMLTGAAITVASSARAAGLQWRGISPAVGMLIGALPLLAPLGWQYLESRRHPEAPPTPQAAALAPGSAPTATHWSPALVLRSRMERDPASAAQRSPESDDALRDRLLGELATILSDKARPAIHSIQTTSLLPARHADPDSFRSKLDAAQRGMADLRGALDKIKYDNPSLGAELDAALGDMSALGELDSGLRETGDSAADQAASVDAAQKLQGAALRANQWLLGAEKRIEELRVPVGSAR